MEERNGSRVFVSVASNSLPESPLYQRARRPPILAKAIEVLDEAGTPSSEAGLWYNTVYGLKYAAESNAPFTAIL